MFCNTFGEGQAFTQSLGAYLTLPVRPVRFQSSGYTSRLYPLRCTQALTSTGDAFLYFHQHRRPHHSLALETEAYDVVYHVGFKSHATSQISLLEGRDLICECQTWSQVDAGELSTYERIMFGDGVYWG